MSQPGRGMAEALLESEERFRLLVESVREYAIFMLDPEGHVVSWNRGAERLKGYQASEIIGQHFSRFYPAENKARATQAMEVAVQSGSFHEQGWRVRKDGTRFWADVTLTALRDTEGRLRGFAKVTRDETAHRMAEEALRHSEALLQDAQHLAHMGSWEWKVATGEVSWSDELFAVYGLDPARDVPTYQTFLDRAHPEDRARLQERLQAGLTEEGAFELEARIVRPDGEVRVVQHRGRAVRDAAGQPVGMVGTSQDVTHRKRAEDEQAELLREQAARAEAEASNRRSSFLAEVSHLLGSSLDYESTLGQLARLMVPSLADWCGVDIVQADGTLISLAVTHGDPVKVALAQQLRRRHPPRVEDGQGIHSILRTGRPQMIPAVDQAMLAAVATDPEHLALLQQLDLRSYIGVPLLARGRTLGVLGLAHSESGRRYGPADLALAEEIGRRAGLAVDNARLYRDAQQANRVKDEFLATLSHELRTPLNAIVGWSHLLMEGQLDAPTTTKAVETIHRNAQSQSQIISDILDVSRIIAGKLRLQVREVHLAEVIRAALDTVRPAADAKGIHMVPLLDPSAGPISGDPDRLQQVAWNLLANAIKFTPRAGEVQVHLEPVHSQVELRVEDSGTGIAPEFLPYVFERFRQADSSSTRRHGGLGLGLAIVRHLVELHGGSVSARNREDGPGAVFTVSLPRRSISEPAPPPPAPREPAADPLVYPDSAELQGVRVLVVDDELDTRELVSMVLGRRGAAVTTASSADEALERLEQEPPDVLLADIEMPGQDGYELIRRVRALPPERGGNTPAAALTAYAATRDRMNALRAGFQIHLPKPVHPAELVTVVASLATNFRRSGGR